MAGGGSTYASSGRGGAGNFVDSTQSPRLQPEDLQTPTLKTPVVTTGRGGSGNMAKNVDPAETRARQDVQPWVVFFYKKNHHLFQVVAGRLTNKQCRAPREPRRPAPQRARRRGQLLQEQQQQQRQRRGGRDGSSSSSGEARGAGGQGEGVFAGQEGKEPPTELRGRSMFGAVSLWRGGGRGGARVSTKVMACYKEGEGVDGNRRAFFWG